MTQFLHAFVKFFTFTCSTLGSASFVDDYVSTPPMIFFPVGSMNGAEQCLNFSTVDDPEFEGDEDFFVDLFTSAMVGILLTTRIIILDNDGEL